MHTILQKPFFQILLGLVLTAVLVALGSYAHLTWKQAQGAYTGDMTINVSGTGEVFMVPDIGQFTFAVRAEGGDGETAQAESAESLNTIVDWLQAEGVAESDIKTTQYSLQPKYRYEERACVNQNGYCPPGERIIDGFTANQSVEVKVRDLDTASKLISGVGERGATNISGLQFTLDDESAVREEARMQAIAEAKAKAETLANALDKELHRLVGFHENDGGQPVPYGMGGDEMMREQAADSAPALPAGENEVKVQVNLSYELR